jgi:hypothetical protein
MVERCKGKRAGGRTAASALTGRWEGGHGQLELELVLHCRKEREGKKMTGD